VPPNVGNNGQGHSAQYGPCACITTTFISGGGGGFVLPGVGGLAQTGTSQSLGRGGGSGGAGSAYDRLGTSRTFNNNGGTANGAAPSYTTFTNAMQSGGGGGWGARGGDSYVSSNIVGDGEPGGNSIITNGNAITTITAGTQYGALRTTGTTYVQTLSSSATPTTVTIPAGYLNAIIIVPTGVTLRANNNLNYALYITSLGGSVENVKIIVNGAILGKGGDGGSDAAAPTSGGNAIRIENFSVTNSVTVDCTYGYVASGGGGGGFGTWVSGSTYGAYGGGGAGGGNSGNGSSQNIAFGATTAGASGSNGTIFYNACEDAYYISGGGGGLIVPGASVSLGTKTTADPFPGIGGSGGGSGAARKSSTAPTGFINDGGGFNGGGGQQFGNLFNQAVTGGGGGGWGANGGGSRRITLVQQAGATGGYAVYTEIGIPPIYVINPANIAGVIY
jgi:hypothetical protein